MWILRIAYIAKVFPAFPNNLSPSSQLSAALRHPVFRNTPGEQDVGVVPRQRRSDVLKTIGGRRGTAGQTRRKKH